MEFEQISSWLRVAIPHFKWNGCFRALLLLAAAPFAVNAGAQELVTGKRIFDDGPSSGTPGCSACHGETGQGNTDAGIPKLAGLDAPYVTRQLWNFHNGIRDNAIMVPYAQALDGQQISAVADYVASLPHSNATTVEQTSAKLAHNLIFSGNLEKGLPACSTCHGGSGEGYATAPSLAGQSQAYIEQALKGWRQGERPEGPDYFMVFVSKRLTDADIKAVADYYASLPSPAPAPSATQH